MKSRDKQKLSDFIQRQFKSAQKQILDLAEVAIPPHHWEAFRSKILRITNDTRRFIDTEIESNYDLKYDPSVEFEDVVEIKTAPIQSLNKKERSIVFCGQSEKDKNPTKED